MATLFQDLFYSAWRNWNTINQPSTGEYDPDKTEIRAIGPALDGVFALIDQRFIGLTSGVQPKMDVAVAVFANVNIASALVNGAVFNGVTVTTGQRVALLGQTTGATFTDTTTPYAGRTNSPQNGVYTVVAAGAAPRATDMDTGPEMVGATFFARGGTVGRGTTWKCNAVSPITLGTTELLFSVAGEQNTSIPGGLDALRGLASAQATTSSMNLTTATGDLVPWTGTTAVNSVTLGTGLERWVVATDAFTINPSATLIGDNGGLAVDVKPGDALLFKGDVGGVVRFWRMRVTPQFVETGDKIIIFATTDALGRAGFSVSNSSRGGFQLQAGATPFLAPIERPNEKVIAWAAAEDRLGRTPIWVGHDGGIRTNSGVIFPGGGTGGGGFSAAEIIALDGWALAQSALIRQNGNPALKKFTPGKAHVGLYGQSLSADAIGHPPRRASDGYDGMMLGDSVFSSNAASAAFNPFGGSATLKALATTVLNSAGNALLDSTQIEALDWMDGANGSDQATAFAGMAKFLWLQESGQDSDSTRRFVMTSTGRGGRNIAELSKTTTFYDRTVDGAAKIHAADATSYLQAILFAQGEADVGEATPYATYRAAVAQLFNDFDADISVGINGQGNKAAKLMHQPSSKWVTDATNQDVQMALLSLAESEPDIFMVGPTYNYTNKTELDGHLDANGYAWMGSMSAKVFAKVVLRGEGWQPLKMLKAVQRGNEIMIMYNVPVPPLAFRDAWAGFTATNYARKGFKVTVGGVSQAITDVAIVGQATIKLTLGALPGGTCRVWYASQSTAGQGNVFDSDPTKSIFNYLYLPAAGDDATANVAALVNKPLPLWNAAVVQILDSIAA